MRALRALISLTLLAGLILFGLLHRPAPAPTGATLVYNDLSLYRDVVTDMRRGSGYYEAAVSEARKHDFPLRPFVTVRLPTLAWLLSSVPSEAFGRGILMVLALAAFCAWAVRLSAARLTKPQYGLAMIGLTSGILPAVIPDFVMFHETWAGVLIALSLAVRRKDAWVASVLIGLTAALTRELAGAYLLAMAAMAFKERNFREAVAWIMAIAVLALALILHATNVHALVTSADIVSPGWLAVGGWGFVLHTLQWNAFLILAPHWLIALVVPLALFGLTAPQIDQRLLLIVGGYVMAFFTVGRSDNLYWGLLIAPLWPLGLVGLVSVIGVVQLRPNDSKRRTTASFERPEQQPDREAIKT